MATTKKCFYADRAWWHSEIKKVVGDMAFSFNDSADSRTEDIAEVIDGTEWWINSKDSNEESGDYNNDFAIYEIYEATLELEEEDVPLWSGEVKESNLIKVYACATREGAKDCKLEKFYNTEVIYKK